MSRQVMNIRGLSAKRFHTLPIEGKFRALLGEPERNFTAILYGPSTGGKSTLALELADHLALKFGRVFYNSWEEGFNQTLRDRAEFIGVRSSRLYIGNRLPFDEMVKRIRSSHYRFIFIDSVQFAAFTYDDHKELTRLFPKKSFIYVSQATGEDSTDGANRILFAVDCKVFVKEGKAFARSRYLKEQVRLQLFKTARTTAQTALFQ